MMDLRLKGMPVTFLVVLMLTVMLTIFFGAWAASADSQAQDRSFSFAIGTSAPDADTVAPSENGSPDGAAAVESTDEAWWGSAFLKACPLH
ncbi:MAG: hypothetical protein J4F43_09170 [Dehalococcoidia bacterium]|nr:hypothetical protein [Dehalococcoidia bacterium]